MKPPTYSIHRNGRGSGIACLVIQLRHHSTGAIIPATDLACYVALGRIETPWYRMTVGKRSKLFLTDEAAADMLAAGTIEPLPPADLIPWREAKDRHKAQAEDDLKV